MPEERTIVPFHKNQMVGVIDEDTRVVLACEVVKIEYTEYGNPILHLEKLSEEKKRELSRKFPGYEIKSYEPKLVTT